MLVDWFSKVLLLVFHGSVPLTASKDLFYYTKDVQYKSVQPEIKYRSRLADSQFTVSFSVFALSPQLDTSRELGPEIPGRRSLF